MPLRQRARTWELLAASGVAVNLTGSTSETVMVTVNIAAGRLGANGLLRVEALWTVTNNANAKTANIRLNGIGGLNLQFQALASQASGRQIHTMWMRNSQSSQIWGGVSGGGGGGLGVSLSALRTMTIDMSAARDLVLTGQLGVGTDTMTLEAYTVEFLPRA